MFKNRYIRIIAIVLATFLALLLIVWAAAGPVAKPQLVKWLKSQGAETVDIESLTFNPFRPSLQMKALTLNADKGRPLFLERVYVRLSWLGMLHKQIHVRRFEIQTLHLRVDQKAGGLTIGGLKPGTGAPAKPSSDQASKQTNWLLRLDDLIISSSRVELVLPEFTTTIGMEKAWIHNGVLGKEAVLGEFVAKGRLNEAPLRINALVNILNGKGAVKGKLNLDQLALGGIHPLIDDTISRLQGQLSLKTQWQIDIDGPAMALDQSVTLQMSDLDMETHDMILGQKQGTIQIELTARANGQKIETAHIKRLAVNDAHLAIAMKKKAHPKTDQAPSPSTGTTNDRVAVKSDQSPPAIGMKIDAVEVTGDTRIAFSDHNLDPAFSEAFRHFNFKMTDLDNRDVEKTSPFILSAEIQKYGKLNFSGSLKPFSPNLYVDLSGRISEYGLPPVSGYTQNMLGYHIRTGQLNADLALKIENRLLDGQTELDLKALKLTPSDKSTSDKLTKQVTMPLDLALGYISDDKGNLQLKMPIKGSLDDPDFGISHLCQIVMVKAAKTAAYSYLKTMLLPYGALVRIGVDVAVKAGQKIISLKLAPLVYQPGIVEVGPESKAYIDQLVDLMAKEPNMRLIICSVATQADLATPKGVKTSDSEREKQMLALAKARMDSLKQMLIETHGIESYRLLDCYPKVDEDPEGLPRIEIDL